MISAPIPENEGARISALHDSCLLDTPQEAEFDEIVKLASLLCNTPISLISWLILTGSGLRPELGLM